MELPTSLTGSKVMHGVLYPKFEGHRVGIITSEGEEYEIVGSKRLSQLRSLLYEPVRVIGKLASDRSRLKVLSMEPENEPPETDGVFIQTTAFPTIEAV